MYKNSVIFKNEYETKYTSATFIVFKIFELKVENNR